MTAQLNSSSANQPIFSGDVIEGGKETYNGKNWIGKVPATRDYYVYVTAHPTAQYALKVTVK